MSGIQAQVMNKYMEIKQDLISNLRDVFNRQNYYTRKYRGNRLTDINVAVDITPERTKIIQIFVRHKDHWVRDRMEFDSNGYIGSEIKGTMYD